MGFIEYDVVRNTVFVLLTQQSIVNLLPLFLKNKVGL
jgi:hypothetical protein